MPEFMQSVFSSADGNYAVRMAAVCWVLWLVRNAIVWQNEVRTVDSVCMQVQRLQLIWKDAYTKTNLSVNNNIPTAWTPPQHGFLKCNVDVAIFDDGAGYGAVLRDHHGLFVAAKADRLMATRDPLLAEALAVKEALSWIKDSDYSSVIIETDCLNFVLAFHSRSVDFSYVGCLVKHSRSLASDIGNVSVRHVKRLANQVAHVLARATGSSSGLGSWFSFPPGCISELLIH
ncbi:uncharacterized protein LOC116024043 [Ipomoea triloba]|uniref:uncharacterized protein LOC116024043 n=1 Tax=Ipomoea triloba TaxID=35885 RepID=UPI00125D5BFE|nr:uncharacterized protein LOC116024043 [Ipomoea triloba]